MMKKLSIFLVVALMGLMGCAGHQTFNHLARSNDTVAVAAGWMQTFTRDTMRVTITDFNGTQTIYEPGNPNVRAVINMYPDPASNIVVSRETGINIGSPAAATEAGLINSNYTGGDNDWWQTIVFVNLADNMALGDADVLIESIDPVTSQVVETASSTVEVIPGVGEALPFSAMYPWGIPFNLSSNQLRSLERSSNYQIDFAFIGGTEIPAAISLELMHDPDIDNGGAGRAYVVNPTSETKSINWVDNGTVAKAIILPVTSSGFTSLVDFKFYVSGIDNVVVSNLQAFNQDGVEIFTVGATSTKR